MAKRIPQLDTGTLGIGSLFETAQVDNGSVTGYNSTKVSTTDIGDFVATEQQYTGLQTTAKTLVNAINEAAQGGGGGSSTLAGLSDVDITTPTDGQILTYDSANQEWVNANGGGGSSTLAGLSDVDITTPTDGQVLSYDSVNQEWVNADVGDASKVELTQAQYDALEQAGTLDPTVLYFITDGQSGNEIIDDTTTSANKVWSSDKTDSEIQAVASDVATKQDDLSCGQLANVDLDDYKTNGFYWVSQTNVSNKPATNFGYLIVAKPSTVIQIFICFANDSTTTRGDMYVRFFANSQWYSWVKIADSIPDTIKVTRTNLTQQGSALNSFVFAVPAITGYTRMLIGFNPSNSSAMYVRSEDDGNNLKVFIQNNLGTSITYDVTIAVAYIRN